MRITVRPDPALMEQARKLTGIEGKTALVNAAFKALVERESADRLARLGGAEPQLVAVRRRRF